MAKAYKNRGINVLDNLFLAYWLEEVSTFRGHCPVLILLAVSSGECTFINLSAGSASSQKNVEKYTLIRDTQIKNMFPRFSMHYKNRKSQEAHLENHGQSLCVCTEND